MRSLTTGSVIHVMSSDNPPAMAVKSGETFSVETAKPGIPDEVFSRDYTKQPFPKRVLTITGPIFVEDAEPGDVLKVKIESIELDTMGKMWMGQWMGVLMDEVDHCYMRKVAIDRGEVRFSDSLSFPIRPMIGTIGVAPAGDGVDCVLPGSYGGNMDSLSAAPGNTIYLPVYVPGALLAVGDVHAAMGYGEVLGTGIETGSTVVMTVELIKNRELKHPVAEAEEFFEIIVSDTDFMQACKELTRAAIDFVSERRGCGFDEGYAIVGQTCDLKVLQIVNYCVTVSMRIPKLILEKKKI